MKAEAKLTRLEHILRAAGPVVVAYSGGVDSSLLAVIAQKILGKKHLAVTACSAIRPKAELDIARRIARRFKLNHLVVPSGEMGSRQFRANPADRCYHCKDLLWRQLWQIAKRHGLTAVIDGSTADDIREHRPGKKASIKYGIQSPLSQAGLTKAEVRRLARRMGLPNWESPSNSCLATRIPYGNPIMISDLKRIERSECRLKGLGFANLRVRHHGDLARIEVSPEQFNIALKAKDRIVSALRREGYRFVTLDLAGYQKGCYDKRKDAEGKNSPVA